MYCFLYIFWLLRTEKFPITKFRYVCVNGWRIIPIHEAITLLIFLHLYQRFLKCTKM